MAQAAFTPTTTTARARRPRLAKSSHPDAELLRLGREAEAIAQRLDEFEEALPGYQVEENPEYCALNERHADLFEKIAESRAQTLEGLAVKARASVWCPGDKFPVPDRNDMPGRLGVSILQDILVHDLLALKV